MPVSARMRLESVSKIWTAVLVLQLVEQGRLGLKDTVERWLPGLLPFGDRITLRQLLTHTSGIFDNNQAVNHPDRMLDGSRVVVLLLNGRMPTRPGVTFGPRRPWTGCTARLDRDSPGPARPRLARALLRHSDGHLCDRPPPF
jgi:CubicO group peptidase (beta-lactamase class C family)